MSSAVSAPLPREATSKPRLKLPRSGALILGAIVFITLLIWAWFGLVKDRVTLRNWGEVEAGKIYRSGQISHWRIASALANNHIDQVEFMSIDKDDRVDVQAEAAAAEKLGVRRLNFPLDGDGTGDIQQYAAAITEMVRATDQGKRVLVHCQTGAQRTGGTIGFYRLLVQKRPPAEVFSEMIEYGFDPRYNAKLIPYMNQHMRELAEALVASKVIGEVPNPLPVLNQ